jgi:UDP-N-acetyl-D-glucosamine dehydrogenase
MQMQSVTDLYAAVRQADCVVVITNHKTYDYAAILAQAALVVDTRNAFAAAGLRSPKIVKM